MSHRIDRTDLKRDAGGRLHIAAAARHGGGAWFAEHDSNGSRALFLYRNNLRLAFSSCRAPPWQCVAVCAIAHIRT
jgi:hypothetical protein